MTLPQPKRLLKGATSTPGTPWATAPTTCLLLATASAATWFSAVMCLIYTPQPTGQHYSNTQHWPTITGYWCSCMYHQRPQTSTAHKYLDRMILDRTLWCAACPPTACADTAGAGSSIRREAQAHNASFCLSLNYTLHKLPMLDCSLHWHLVLGIHIQHIQHVRSCLLPHREPAAGAQRRSALASDAGPQAQTAAHAQPPMRLLLLLFSRSLCWLPTRNIVWWPQGGKLQHTHTLACCCCLFTRSLRWHLVLAPGVRRAEHVQLPQEAAGGPAGACCSWPALMLAGPHPVSPHPAQKYNGSVDYTWA